MPGPTPITLNPLPTTAAWSSSAFNVAFIGKVARQGMDPSGATVANLLFSTYGDLTGDGWPEIVLSGWSYRGWNAPGKPPAVPITVISTSPTGTKIVDSAALLGVSSYPGTAMLRIADFNGDGRNDLFIAGHNESPFTVTQTTLFTWTASGFTAKQSAFLVTAHEGHVGDFDGDGKIDAVLSAYYSEGAFPAIFATGANGSWYQASGSKSVLLLEMNDGQGGFKSYPLVFDRSIADLEKSDAWQAGNWGGGSASAFADFDGDGKTDVVVVDLNTRQDHRRGDSYVISDIQFEAASAYGKLTKLPLPYFVRDSTYAGAAFSASELSHDIQVMPFDYNNDGLMDILINSMVWNQGDVDGGQDYSVTQVLRNDGGLKFTDVTDQVFYNAYLGKQEPSHDSILADVNGDGFLDLISTAEPDYITGGVRPNSASNEVFINTGNGKFVSALWSQFSALTEAANALLVGMGIGRNSFQGISHTFFPYMTPDKKLGFVTSENVWLSTSAYEQYFFNVTPKVALSTGPGGVNPALQGASGFNEAYYLTEHTSAAAAVQAKTYASGLEHYLAVGRATGLLGFAKNASVEGSAAADTIVLREGAEKAFGHGGADLITGGAGNDFIDGGDGVDTAIYSGVAADYSWTKAADGSWTVRDLRPGSPDGADQLNNVEILRFSDKSVALSVSFSAAIETAFASILRSASTQASQGAIASDLMLKVAGGLTDAQAIAELVKAADATTSVASMSYQFFTGKVPSARGFDFLVSPTGPNGANLNSEAYAKFNTVNRYINFAMNLGRNGEAKDSFATEYGSLTLFEATRKAYGVIFGSVPNDAKVSQLLEGRIAFLASFSGDPAEGVGTKAAMVGFLLAAAATENLGVIARSNDAWLTDLADGSAPYAVNLLDPAAGYYRADFIFGG
ncbi:FG-GAP-like repeat-containing protein [Caulobacter sp. RHG1]|uniref:FG-GAP-like repeat-containing protein n=1 Tax=Caulobacter sp. (strain RHG1) TaxID=2545762 RepID=UPI0015582D40|nr:FG-GAP-like repeat-containing protein [Caulobacter sp. RHG1]NQE60608.1 hypothetical protein [Caulobacter sp. RHG1]